MKLVLDPRPLFFVIQDSKDRKHKSIKIFPTLTCGVILDPKNTVATSE
jgi:hypothetical protein